MKSFATSAVLSAFVLGLVCLQPGFTDDKPAAKKSAKEDGPKLKIRLPNYFGKLGLSEEQREKVLAVRTKYGTQIGELQKQIEELRAKEGAEVLAILSGDQKDQLEKLEKQAQERRDAKAAAAEQLENKKPAANGSETKEKEKEKKDK